MNVSKSLSAAIAAATIVGAVGFAVAQTTPDPAAAPATPSTGAMQSPAITPGNTQAAAPDASTQAPTEGTQGTQSGPAPSADNSSSSAATPATAATPAPAANDGVMALSERQPKADRN